MISILPGGCSAPSASPRPCAFDDMTIRDRGVPCDRAAAVEDATPSDGGGDD